MASPSAEISVATELVQPAGIPRERGLVAPLLQRTACKGLLRLALPAITAAFAEIASALELAVPLPPGNGFSVVEVPLLQRNATLLVPVPLDPIAVEPSAERATIAPGN